MQDVPYIESGKLFTSNFENSSNTKEINVESSYFVSNSSHLVDNHDVKKGYY